MRNLKRTLSLVLAMALVVGMMMVGASAASSDFTDSSEITYTEAVDVMTAIGVMEGTDTGAFNPSGILTREQAAAIICRMLLGDSADDLNTNSSVFTDVAADRWSAGYISYCAQQGILAGTGTGAFNPEGELTGLAFAKMLLVALGYDAAIEEYVGDDWAINVAADAIEAGVSINGQIMTNSVSREQAAQMAFQTLEADMVRYANKGTTVIGSDGMQVIVGASAPERFPISGSSGEYLSNDNDGYTQFCERYFSDLKKDESGHDGMQRVAKNWTYKNDDIGTYAETPDRTVVVDKSQSLADEVTDINRNWTTITNSYLNGGALSGNLLVGDIVEIYLDDTKANTVERAIVTRYSVDEVTGSVATRGSVEDDDLEIRIPGFIGYTDADKVDGDYNDLAKDDVIYYYRDADGVYHFAKAESVEGQLTGSKSGNPVKYVIDGEDYVVNGSVGTISGVTTSPVYNTTYAYYMDNNGYLIAAKEVETAQSKDYVVVQDIQYAQGTGGLTGSAKVEARLVSMDGTTQVVTVESVKLSDGKTYDDGDDKLAENGKVNTAVSDKADKAFFTYSVNSDGEYALTEVAADTADKRTVGTLTNGTIDNGSASLNSSVAVNNNTVFVVATESAGKSFTTYTGMNAVADITGANGAYVAVNGIATYVYVDSYTSSSISGDYVFFMKGTEDAKMSEKDGDTTLYYNTYKAIVDGEATTVKVKANSDNALSLDSGSANPAVGLFTPVYNDDGLITKLTVKNEGQAAAAGYTLDGGALVTSGGTYTCEDDALVFIMDEDGNVTEATAAEISEDDNDTVYVVKTNTTDSVVDFLFIIEVDDDVVNVIAPSEPATLVVNETPSEGSTGSVTVELSGEIESGLATNELKNYLLGGAGEIAGVDKFSAIQMVFPAGSYGVRQTNEILKNSIFWVPDGSVDTTTGVKTTVQNLPTDTTVYFLLGEKGITVEFDWDYTGAEGQEFKADYTIVVSADDLTINPAD